MDITNHEFADSISNLQAEPLDDAGTLVINIDGSSWVFFDKDDVIAMAQHFNVTEFDLQS